MAKKPRVGPDYLVTVEWKRTSVWGVPKTHVFDMQLTRAELEAFVRETFAHDADVHSIRFQGSIGTFTRFRNQKMGDV